MDKKGKIKWYVPVAIGVILLLAFGVNPLTLLQNALSGATTPTTQAVVPVQAGTCPAGTIIADTTVTLDAKRKFVSGTALAGRNFYRIKDGGSWSAWASVADAGTFTSSPGTNLQILWVLTGGSVASGHYAEFQEEVVPCEGTVTYTKDVIQSGTPTVRVYSDDNGNLLDSGGVENETTAAGELVNLKLEYQNAFETGNPHGFVIVTRWNRTSVDDVTINIEGKQLATVGIPVRYTTTTGNHVQKAFFFPGFTDSLVHSGAVIVDIDDTNNPQTCVGTGDLCAINFTWEARNYFLTDSDEYALGPEDTDDNNRTGQADMNLGSFYLD